MNTHSLALFAFFTFFTFFTLNCNGEQFAWNNNSLYRPLNAPTVDLNALARQGIRSGGMSVDELQRRFPQPSLSSLANEHLPVRPSPPSLVNEHLPVIPQSFFVEAEKRLSQAVNDIEPTSTNEVSSLAKQLLNLPVANQQQLFSAVSAALGGRQLPLDVPITRVQPPADPFGTSDTNQAFLPVETFQTTASSVPLPPTYIPSILQQLPSEQRNLLQAAIRSGELSSDPTQLLPAINSVLTEHRASTALPIPNSLQNWLQQYSKQTGEGGTNWLNLPTQLLPKGLIEQLGAQSAPAANFVPPTPLAPDKLPYYGKYCGSFTENRDPGSTRHYNVQGAVWVIDEQHLLVSKFTFQPGFFQKENITFWAGPDEKTGDAVTDMFPSDNGIFLQPEKIDLRPFLTGEKKVQIAKQPNAAQVSKIFNRGSNKSADADSQSNHTHEPHPEPETKAEPGGILSKEDKFGKVTPETGLQVDAAQPTPEPVPKAEPASVSVSTVQPTAEPVPKAEPRRVRRDFFPPRWPSNPSDLYGDTPQYHPIWEQAGLNSVYQQPTNLVGSQLNNDVNSQQQPPSRTVHLIVDGGMVKVASSDLVNDKLDLAGDNTVFLPTLPGHLRPSTLVTAAMTEEATTSPSTTISTTTSTTTSTTAATATSTTAATSTATESSTITVLTTETQLVKTLGQKDKNYTPLQWYAGYEPLLLKLPDGKKISDLHWLSIWDHDNEQAIASVLIPNGPGFKVPSPVVLHGLKSNGLRKVGSGSIEVVNTKTIKINDFFYEGDAPGAWFMVGKDLLPNPSGEILPILQEKNGTYDCDFLKPFDTQTVILKLPGDMEIKDVFWLSVFCVPFAISFAQIYLPYNDIHVPPDMTGQSAPYCVLETPSR